MNVALEVAGFQYNHLATLLEQPLYATRQMEGQFSSPHTNCREEGGGLRGPLIEKIFDRRSIGFGL